MTGLTKQGKAGSRQREDDMRKIAAIAALLAAQAFPATAEIAEVREDELHKWIMTSTAWPEMPGDYYFSLPYSTATGAYGITFGEIITMGYADKASRCTQACFSQDLWEGLNWSSEMGIKSRKDFAETPEIQDYVQSNRVLLTAAMIDGYVDPEGTIGFRKTTPSGSLQAASLIGAYGFRVWHEGGYSAEALPEALVNASGMTRNDLYSELIRRVSSVDLPSPVSFSVIDEAAE